MSSSIRDVRRRIRSVASTEQMTQAMKTVAVSKHSRARERYEGFQAYDSACREMMERLGESALKAPPHQKERVCYLVLTANRGLCGSFHTDLMRRLDEMLDMEEREVVLVVCGKWGREHFEERGDQRVIRTFETDDLPAYSSALEISEYLTDLYRTGEAAEIVILGQRFENLLIQTPWRETFLPRPEHEAENGDVLYLSERKAFLRELTSRGLAAIVYGRLLASAVGAHAAMLVAMRAANDSSEELLEELTKDYHRLRQAAVTTEVLELAGNGESNAGI